MYIYIYIKKIYIYSSFFKSLSLYIYIWMNGYETPAKIGPCHNPGWLTKHMFQPFWLILHSLIWQRLTPASVGGFGRPLDLEGVPKSTIFESQIKLRKQMEASVTRGYIYWLASRFRACFVVHTTRWWPYYPLLEQRPLRYTRRVPRPKRLDEVKCWLQLWTSGTSLFQVPNSAEESSFTN